ncbi:MAG: ferric-dicitrate binding protein FerR (iron transport regulator) [Mariniblastus sp.]|jgi:ferric-dicitrate binding protein FerR (iron transport regulator)
MNDEKFEELTALLITQLDGTIDEQTERRLAELLRDDPEAQACYVEYCQMHAMLAWEHGVLTEGKTDESMLSTKRVKPNSLGSFNSRSWQAIAIAATLLLAVSGGWLGYQRLIKNTAPIARTEPITPSEPAPPQAWETREILAVVSKSHGARLSVPEVALNLGVGDEVRSGVYDLTGGFVELTFGNGVEVIVESPALFEIETEMRMVLSSGRLSAIVSPQGEGFTVETPSADMVDLGTEFAIEVSHDGQGDDEFHVFRGEILVKPKSDKHLRQIGLLGGQATRIDHRTSTPAGIDIDHQRFIRNFDTAPMEYRNHVMKLEPDVYYLMRLEADGRTLRNEVDDLAHANVFTSNTEFLHWAPGFNGGTAFRMNGMNTETYAVAADYPKSQDDQLTVVAWVYAETRPWWGSIAKNWEQSREPNRRGQFHFGLFELSGVLEAHINDNDNVEQIVMDTIPLPLHRWQHVAMVADGSVLRLYRNGQEVAATPYNGLNGNPRIKQLAIGNKLGDDSLSPARPDSGFWDGSIDHLAIFNKALTPLQIRQLFATGEASIKKSQSVLKQD